VKRATNSSPLPSSSSAGGRESTSPTKGTNAPSEIFVAASWTRPPGRSFVGSVATTRRPPVGVGRLMPLTFTASVETTRAGVPSAPGSSRRQPAVVTCTSSNA